MNCKICKNSNLEILNLDKKYYYCSYCEAIFLASSEILTAVEEKERYEDHDNTKQNEGYVQMFKDFIAEVIEPYINLQESNSVLEFGCGPGPVLADLLEKKGLKVDIYDPYFFENKIFIDKKYDLITSTEVFEHFSDPIKEIEMLLSHLKKDAYLAVMTSFHPGKDEFEDWWYKWDPTHIFFYNQKTFKKIAAKYNLKIIFSDQEKYILFKA